MRAIVALALVVVAAASAVSAGATIVPQRGMAGVALGMSPAAVRAKLGKPLRIVRGRNVFGPYTEFHYPFLLRVHFQGNDAVSSVATTGRKERTAAGVGVGSTQAQVRAGVANVRCERLLNQRHCYVGSFRPGTRVTDFFIRNGRVTRVVIGFVLD